jgi:hypothetical protein
VRPFGKDQICLLIGEANMSEPAMLWSACWPKNTRDSALEFELELLDLLRRGRLESEIDLSPHDQDSGRNSLVDTILEVPDPAGAAGASGPASRR